MTSSLVHRGCSHILTATDSAKGSTLSHKSSYMNIKHTVASCSSSLLLMAFNDDDDDDDEVEEDEVEEEEEEEEAED